MSGRLVIQVLISSVTFQDAEGERMTSPTGFGSVPLDLPRVRFLLGRGYPLEQVERGSRLRSPIDRAASGPRDFLVAVVEHVPSASLVGMTEVSVPEQLDRPLAQNDTIVARAHRGQRLGTVLKIANLLHIDDMRPGHPSIITFNAEENRHMLDVNEAVGFVPMGYEGAWKKVLSTP